MRDPDEGVGPDGAIVTGVRRDRVPATFEPVLAAAIDPVSARSAAASLYLYGSVANGTARAGVSDVDLMTIGLPPADADEIARDLSQRFAAEARGVEIGAAQTTDFAEGGSAATADERYGNRVFVRHYCVHLAGPDRRVDLPAAMADVRAARGFNGDIGRHAARWHAALESDEPLEALARRIGRKTLLAVAGLVSVHDATWTTDRASAADRWSELRPDLAAGLAELAGWADPQLTIRVHIDAVRAAVGAVVGAVVESFADDIGLWP